MAEKKISTRIINKHDSPANWDKATFAPLKGEFIIYDADADNPLPRVKIGDGVTPVGELDFVVDPTLVAKAITDLRGEALEEVDKVNSKYSDSIKNISISGRTITVTRQDEETFTLTTQDTDSNDKVQNTSNANKKAYVTGTTATENPSSQIYDPNVYLGDQPGQLYATTFIGDLSGSATKATNDGSGNNIIGTYETKASAASRLAEAKGYTDTKTADMNKEAFLTWGGRSLKGELSPIGTALSDEHSANRIAYLNPAALSFERSADAGSTWSALTISNEDKIKHVTTASNIATHADSSTTLNQQVRMTLTAATTEKTYLYIRPKKLLINVSSPHPLQVKVEYKNGVSNNTTWNSLGTFEISGWSAWNEIDLSKLETLGGGTTQTSNNWYLRLTYSVKSLSENYLSTPGNISGIRIFGDTCWISTSNMGKHGHLYDYDWEQNATFPKNVTANMMFAENFVGRASTAGNAETADLAEHANAAARAQNDIDGNPIIDHYATKEELENGFNPVRLRQDLLYPRNDVATIDLSSDIYKGRQKALLQVERVVCSNSGEDMGDNQYLWDIYESETHINTWDLQWCCYSLNEHFEILDNLTGGYNEANSKPFIYNSDVRDNFRYMEPSFTTNFVYPGGGCWFNYLAGDEISRDFVLMFKNMDTNKLYLVPVGSHFNEYENLGLVLSADAKKLYVRRNFASVHCIEIPEEAEFYSIGWIPSETELQAATDAHIAIYKASLSTPKFTLYFSNTGKTGEDWTRILSGTDGYMDCGGEYAVINTGSDTLTTIAELHGKEDLTGLTLEILGVTGCVSELRYTLRYFRDGTELPQILEMLPQTDVEKIAQKTVKKTLDTLINKGYADPDENTEGTFYFKINSDQ